LLCGGTERKTLGTLDGIDLVECPKCKLAHVWPFPKPGELADLYEGDYFKQNGARGGYANYEASSHLKKRSAARIFDAATRGRPPGDVLDIGAAQGILLDVAGQRGWRALGVEPNPEASAAARARGLDVVTGMFPDALKGVDRKFDLITMLDVLEHLTDPLAALKSLRAFLKPGGTVAVLAPDYGGVFRPLMGQHWPHWKPREHLWYFRRSTLRKMFAAAGYADVHAKPFFKTTSVDHLLGDFSKHDGVFGAISRKLLPVGSKIKLPVSLYLDEVIAVGHA
jgi:2-polyprenyl-3-methyl-5-hydroxy-6-metoxy-1,4-benzoquinol methylase